MFNFIFSCVPNPATQMQSAQLSHRRSPHQPSYSRISSHSIAPSLPHSHATCSSSLSPLRSCARAARTHASHTRILVRSLVRTATEKFPFFLYAHVKSSSSVRACRCIRIHRKSLPSRSRTSRKCTPAWLAAANGPVSRIGIELAGWRRCASQVPLKISSSTKTLLLLAVLFVCVCVSV